MTHVRNKIYVSGDMVVIASSLSDASKLIAGDGGYWPLPVYNLTQPLVRALEAHSGQMVTGGIDALIRENTRLWSLVAMLEAGQAEDEACREQQLAYDAEEMARAIRRDADAKARMDRIKNRAPGVFYGSNPGVGNDWVEDRFLNPPAVVAAEPAESWRADCPEVGEAPSVGETQAPAATSPAIAGEERDTFDPEEVEAGGIFRRCRVCGCTETNACVHPEAGPCWWVEADLCSHCSIVGPHATEGKRLELPAPTPEPQTQMGGGAVDSSKRKAAKPEGWEAAYEVIRRDWAAGLPAAEILPKVHAACPGFSHWDTKRLSVEAATSVKVKRPDGFKIGRPSPPPPEVVPVRETVPEIITPPVRQLVTPVLPPSLPPRIVQSLPVPVSDKAPRKMTYLCSRFGQTLSEMRDVLGDVKAITEEANRHLEVNDRLNENQVRRILVEWDAHRAEAAHD